MNHTKTFLLTLALVLAACGANAQGKIATIDLRRIFDEYHKTKTADAAIKDRAADLDKERKTLLDAFQKAKEEYEKALQGTNDQAVSADERDKRKKAAEGRLLDLRAKEQEIGQFDREARTNLEEQQRRMRDKILEEIRSVITAKAKAGSFSMALDTSTADPRQPPVVLYTNGENDLTAAVLDQLNAAAPRNAVTPDKKNDRK
jgi:outer membrane protein